MITKAIIKSINGARNKCMVRVPLFETADSSGPVVVEALVNIPPGIFNNLFVGDVVFIGFEENALEKPIILGKLFKGMGYEKDTKGGVGILDSLLIRTESSSPAATTWYRYEDEHTYRHFESALEVADYILWLEELTKTLISQLESHFICFKNWTQYQLEPENVEVDDGNLDDATEYQKRPEAFACQNEHEENGCNVCEQNCSKCDRNPLNKREYFKLATGTLFPDKA